MDRRGTSWALALSLVCLRGAVAGEETVEARWTKISDAAQWKGQSGLIDLFDGLFGDCEQSPDPGMGVVPTTEEISECKRKQKDLHGRLTDQVVVLDVPITIRSVDRDLHEVEIAIMGWDSQVITRVEDLQRNEFHLVTSLTKDWWPTAGGGPEYEPRKPIVAAITRVVLDAEDWERLNLDSDDRDAWMVGGWYLEARVAFRIKKPFTIKAKKIRQKIGAKWHESQPVIRGVLAEALGWQVGVVNQGASRAKVVTTEFIRP